MKINLLLAAIILSALIASCGTTVGGTAAAQGEPKVTLDLRAHDAQLVSTAGLSCDDGENIGWWTSTDDQVKWTLDVPEAGEYVVQIVFSCDPQFPGSTVKLTVGDQSIEWIITDTGDWSHYVWKEIGKMTLQAGKQPVVVQATKIGKIGGGDVMNLNKIRFSK